MHDAPASLRASAETFLEYFVPFRSFCIVAASPQAERVLGAAMILDPELRGGRMGPTVILDVNIASGTLIARAARNLRDSGNSDEIVAIVLNSLVPRFDWVIEEVQHVVITSAAGAQSLPRRKSAQGSDASFMLAG